MELAPTPLSGSVPMRAAAAFLVSGASAAYRLQSAEPRAIRRAEHLAPVTAETHLHADPATPTVVHPNDRLAHARTSEAALDSTGGGRHKDRAEAFTQALP